MNVLMTDAEGAAFKHAFDNHDWVTTPVGARAKWPQQLSMAVEVLLDTPQPMFILWGEQHCFLFNAAYTRHLGPLWNGMLGGKLAELWAPIWSTVEPFVTAAYSGRGGIAEDVPLKFSPTGFEDTHFYTFSYTPMRGENGTVVGFTTLCTDTTEVVTTARNVVLERNATFRLFEQAPGFVAMTEGPDHRFTFANAAYLEMVGREQVAGMTVDEALPELRDQDFPSILDRVFATGLRYVAAQMPIELNLKGGSERCKRYVTFVYEPMRDESGEVFGIFAEGHDVTDKVLADESIERLRSELVQKNRVSAMGSMAVTIAHELSQPLTAITNYLTAADRLLKDDGSEVADAIRAALENGRRAGKIIHSVREFTMHGTVQREDILLSRIVREAGRLAGSCEGVNLRYSIPASLAVSADPTQVQQVVLNLIKNACESLEGARERRISISSAIMGGKVRVSVEDTGSGIHPNQLPTLFNAFNSTRVEGMGVGLAISRTIIEANGGVIWAENRSGGGARLCFTLPLAA
jgi:signal transduction histidine kinase